MIKYILPVLVFALLVTVFYVGLHKDPSIVPSPLIGKPVPAFSLPRLSDPDITLTDQDLKGEVVLLNVWGSYCIPCRQEHPLLMELTRNNVVDVYGLNYADERDAALKWLETFGDPFLLSAFDEDRRVSIDFGVYGVPETYVIDADGIIRFKHIGAINQGMLDDTILPLIEQLKVESEK